MDANWLDILSSQIRLVASRITHHASRITHSYSFFFTFTPSALNTSGAAMTIMAMRDT